MPRLTVRLYAGARDAVGKATMTIDLPPDGISTAELERRLSDACPALGPVLQVSRIARNGAYVDSPSTRVHAGDDVAVHPPFSGG